MAKPMSMTLPDVVREALDLEAKQWEQDASEFLKGVLIEALRSPSGVLLKLKAPPVKEDPLQPTLFTEPAATKS